VSLLQLENTKLEIPMPKSVLNCTLTSTQGKYTFDPVAKVLSWDVGKIDSQKSPNIRGSVCVVQSNKSWGRCYDHEFRRFSQKPML
jgi:AP-3 complex subunit mu